jgi:CubicO group peptidase (beta-lactamase class C family)
MILSNIKLTLAITSWLAFIPFLNAQANSEKEPLTSLEPPAQIQSTIREFRQEDQTALVIATVKQEQIRIYSFGRLSKENKQRPDGKTIFPIASISKVFTGSLLGIMIEAGQADLEEPVRKELGVKAKFPDSPENPITLKHLATHSSGLPLEAYDRQNLYTPYTTEQLYSLISRSRLLYAPGSQARYGGVGISVLGEALASKADCTFKQLLEKKIFIPLAMNDTGLEVRSDSKAKLAHGYNETLEEEKPILVISNGAAGGIYSTAEDLAKFIEANFDYNKTRVSKGLQRSWQPLRTLNPTTSLGMCWRINTYDGIVWHNGHLKGYRTYLGFIPNKHLGVIILSANEGLAAGRLGERILKQLTAL